MPTWRHEGGRWEEEGRAVKRVGGAVRGMQGELQERLAQHRKKAAPAAKWIKEREEHRGLMRGVFAAWAATRGTMGPVMWHASTSEWAAMRDAETPQRRAARRMREAAARLASFARCCFRKFWAQRVAARRTLRLRIAFLRKAAVRRSWNAVRRHVWAAEGDGVLAAGATAVAPTSCTAAARALWRHGQLALTTYLLVRGAYSRTPAAAGPRSWRAHLQNSTSAGASWCRCGGSCQCQEAVRGR